MCFDAMYICFKHSSLLTQCVTDRACVIQQTAALRVTVLHIIRLKRSVPRLASVQSSGE